jgi:hypothetical protein
MSVISQLPRRASLNLQQSKIAADDRAAIDGVRPRTQHSLAILSPPSSQTGRFDGSTEVTNSIPTQPKRA